MVKKILIVVHDDEQSGNPALGWRMWPQTGGSAIHTDRTLYDWFQIGGSTTNQFASTSEGDVGSLIAQEPLVRATATQGCTPDPTSLFFNAAGNDNNRVRTGGCMNAGNVGHGLGTSYDDDPGDGGVIRPRTDGMLLATSNWGSGGSYTAGSTSAAPGVIGTDSYGCEKDSAGWPSTCADTACVLSTWCQWSKQSGFAYDYAIFVSDTDP